MACCWSVKFLMVLLWSKPKDYIIRIAETQQTHCWNENIVSIYLFMYHLTFIGLDIFLCLKYVQSLFVYDLGILFVNFRIEVSSTTYNVTGKINANNVDFDYHIRVVQFNFIEHCCSVFKNKNLVLWGKILKF
jgi:hypothetical protein